MKVPSAVIGRVRTSSTDQKYLEARAPDTGGPIARGLGQLGQAIGNVAGEWQQDLEREQRKKQAEADRIEQTARAFELDNKYQTAKGGYSTAYNDAQVKAPANGGGFMKEQMAALDKTEADFFTQNPDLDEAQKGEYKLKFNMLREEYGNRSLDFQQKANDAYIKESIDVDFQQKKVALAETPDQMEAYRQELFEKIDKSNLDPFTKMTHKRAVDRGLQLVTMKKTLTDAKVRNASLANVGTMNPEIGSIIDTAAEKYGIPKDAARQFAWIESSADPGAVSKTGATGLFQFTKKTWDRFGRGDRMDPVANAEAFGRLWQHNRTELTKVLGHEPTPGQLYLAHQQGEAGAKALLRNPQATAIDALTPAYDGDRQAATRAVMVNGGSLGMTAGQFANKWISKFGEASPDYAAQVMADPKFSAVTYEDRAALDADSTSAANHLVAQQKATAKAQDDAYLNATLNKAMDGKYSRLDLDEDRAAGRFSDFSQRKQIEDIIKKREEDGIENRATADFLTNGRTSGRTEDDNKLMNKGYTMGGANDRVYSRDPKVMSEVLIPLAQAKGDIPTQLVGDLTGMTRSLDPATAKFGLESLAQLRGSAPAAYAQRVTDEENRRVSQYLDLKDVLPQDELLKRINPNGDPQVLKAQDALRKQALDYLDNKSDATVKGGTILDDTVTKVLSEISPDPWGPGDAGTLPQFAPQAQAMREELRSLIAEEHGVYGNMEQATAAAAKRLKQFWTVSNVNGEPIIMRDAPDNPRAGYKPYATSGVNPDYSWITENIKREAGIKEGQTFQVVSDDTTKAEMDAHNAPRDPAAQTPPPPSYKIVVREPDGTLRDAFPGKRMHFEPSAENKATDGQAFVHAQALDRLSQVRVKLANAEALKEMGGHEIPEEFLKEEEAALAEVAATNPFSTPTAPAGQPLRARPRMGRAGGWLFGTRPEQGPPIPEPAPPTAPLPSSMEEE